MPWHIMTLTIQTHRFSIQVPFRSWTSICPESLITPRRRPAPQWRWPSPSRRRTGAWRRKPPRAWRPTPGYPSCGIRNACKWQEFLYPKNSKRKESQAWQRDGSEAMTSLKELISSKYDVGVTFAVRELRSWNPDVLERCSLLCISLYHVVVVPITCVQAFLELSA